MKCEEVRKNLSLLLYDELSFEREEAVHRHLGECADCRWALERERALQAALDHMGSDPRADLLAKCRRGLRERLATTSNRPKPLRELWSRFSQPLAHSWMKPVAALSLIALGFLGARLTQSSGPLGFFSEPLPAEPVASQVRYLQPDAASGQVRIVLDETRQRVLTGSPDDAAIQRLLLAAARESSDPGLRAVSMDMLKSRTKSSEVRATFLQALESDPNPGVRLKALDGLKGFAAGRETRDVVAKILLTDDNPGVRTEAIDLLTEHRGAEIAGVLQELLDKESNSYVRTRCQKALRAMNASVEMF